MLGDDTSNNRSEWVHQWGLLASGDRPVTVVHWDEAGDVSFTEPDVLSEEREGTPLTIWSASRTGADVTATTARLDLLLAPDGDADAVIVNLGANDEAADLEAGLDGLLAAVRDQVGYVPVDVVLQGTGGAGLDVREAIEAWADNHDVLRNAYSLDLLLT